MAKITAKSIGKHNSEPPGELGIAVPTSDAELGNRISEVVAAVGGDEQAARVTDLSIAQLRRYKKDRSGPTFDALARLAAASGFSLDWIATGKGQKQLGVTHSVAPLGDSYPPAHLLGEGMVSIASLDVRAGFGAGQLVEDMPKTNGFVAFSEDWIRRRLRVDPKDLLAIEGQGDSMSPTIVDGGVVLVWTRVSSVRDGAIYAIVMDGELLVKRLQRLPGGRVRVKTDNPAYDGFELDPDAAAGLQVVGQVIWKGAPA